MCTMTLICGSYYRPITISGQPFANKGGGGGGKQKHLVPEKAILLVNSVRVANFVFFIMKQALFLMKYSACVTLSGTCTSHAGLSLTTGTNRRSEAVIWAVGAAGRTSPGSSTNS